MTASFLFILLAMRFFNFVLVFNISTASCFVLNPGERSIRSRTTTSTSLNIFGSSSAKLPTSTSDRDNQAIDSIKAAIAKPKTATYPLIECEFPPIEALNKLGDGSSRSANEVDQANIAFCAKLTRSISPFPVLGPKTWLLTSSASSNAFNAKIESSVRGSAATVVSLRSGIPDTIGKGDICILVTPSGRSDYKVAEQLAASKIKTVLVNGFAKDISSVSGKATMAYFLKPLTYNSQLVGFLLRNYPKPWSVIDVVSKKVLKTYCDSDILYADSNSPDLREPGRIVQKSVDERAIQARRK